MPEVKDKMTGKIVAKMPYDPAGKMAAEKMVAENPGYEINDGATRSKTMYAGGGETGYNAIGRPMYKKGGSPEDYKNWGEPEFVKAQMEIDAEEKKAQITPKKDSKPKSKKGPKPQEVSGDVKKKGAKGSEGKKGSKKKK